ncbi:DUF4132 domain-containing protein [Escherichia fergusonii]|uniref:DUF4132 domain-containing protein n=1 Tax=Escherichia fergusonii TaxID=564 RepID=UPI0025B63728|nr:DUF4132 domain-containing protein [Escherichia fergusonii]EHK3036138.1 DUF4132 domain-containing protein [Escherichia fergusonii]EHU9786420.1 DUF4132 domain-containing protein [Escherichia fergusonii]MDN4049343.1 DUF4132 domain-containing protein [Escherichia fergusonii]HCO5576320.1 DUF4132 domain-containing protein [Escherichia fergusonii]
MDKELPWLADNAQLELKYKKGKTPLSHRNWPGEPVPVITESLIQTLGDKLLHIAEKKKNIVWRYENFSLEWQSAITQAINLIGEHKPSIPARTMAALACIAQNDSQQLLDEIVQQEGLEYATEVVIARQFIVRCYESDPLVVTLQYQKEDYGYGYRSETYNEFDLRLRKHLSLAEESCWQRCADKLIAALPGIPKVRRPFIALILPEKPEIANELVGLECPRTHFHSKEWLKVVANDPRAVRKLERYWSQDIFSDREASYMSHENHFGYAACAALLREQGIAAVPRLAMYAHKEDCGSLLVQINHPQVIRILLLVADKNKPSLQRVAKYSKNFPHATLAALAELLALKESPARPGYPIIEDKKLPAQQKARDEYWRTLLQTLMASQPQLAEEVIPWLSTQARAVVNSYLSASPKPVIDSTDNSSLPEILVSPPWRGRKKASITHFSLPELTLVPQAYRSSQEHWTQEQQTTISHFSAMPFDERLASRGTDTFLRELGFEDHRWKFNEFILTGQLDALDTDQLETHTSVGRLLNYQAKQNENKHYREEAASALLAQDSVALMEGWRTFQRKFNYTDEKRWGVWNLYLIAQMPREMAVSCWQQIVAADFHYTGVEYLLSVLGTDALPGLITAFARHPKEIFPLLIQFGTTELALPIARVWHRFAGQRNLARQWILQWPEHTATALIPLIFARSGDNSEAALSALRLLYEQGHGELLQTVANRWQHTDVWPALKQLLKQGPMDIYPTRIPKAPDFWHPTMWSRPRLITNNQPVTDDALEIIGEMLRFTQGGRFFCGLEQLKTFCQPQTLAAFAWDLFTAWQQVGAPAKDNWAFLALSLLGDESTARDLTTQILAWPQEGKSARAVSGLNILTLMNNDMALIQLHHISQRAKSRPLRDNAAEFLQVVAENRGLSQEELADRLVPTLGLDDPQALIFDFGPRQFTVRFDENLNPVIFDQQNVRQKSVPRLRADDDQLKAPEALARLKGLKKDATQVSKNLLPRLETALRTTRRWSLADFHSLFVNHPFTRLVTQRLIWAVYPANEPRRLLNAFRVAAEGEFCNAQDEPIDLPADALVGIAHPLEMTAEMRTEFAQLFADYEIMPPFRQLSRRTVLLTPDESTSNSLTRWEGKSATVGQLMGMRYKGWESGFEDACVYDLGEYRLVLKFSPGFNHYSADSKALMSFRSLRVYRDNKSVTFAELDTFDLSEALSAPDIIFH